MTSIEEFLHRVHLARHQAKERYYKRGFQIFLAFTLVVFAYSRLDITLYNLCQGPFHLKTGEVSEYITQLSRDKSGVSSSRLRQRFQAELKPGSVINSEWSELLRNGVTHVASFRKIESPHFYLKVPNGRPEKLFAAKHDFKLVQFSARALRCLIRNLAAEFSNLKSDWVEKHEMVKQLEVVRSENAAAFNAAAIRDCDLVVGFFYRALDDPRLAENFLSYDVILDMNEKYVSNSALMILILLQAITILASMYSLVMFLITAYRPVPVNLSFSDQLEKLGLDGTTMEQVRQLDDILLNASAADKFGKSLVVIKIQERSFVIVFNVDLEASTTYRGSTPIIVCPVADIDEIQTQRGINCSGIWIPWPRTNRANSKIACWLHSNVLNRDISDYYKERFLYKREKAKAVRESRLKLEDLIRQELRVQENRNEGLNLPEMMDRMNLGRAAKPEFIARLRLEQEENRQFVDEDMASEDIQCNICLDKLEEDQAFMASPCNRGHYFHEDCFIEQLRNKNHCPNCRFVFPEADPPPWEGHCLRFLSFLGNRFRPQE